MKLQDKENLDIASAVSDVLEGKIKEKMDPTDHVKEKDGKFCVYDANGKVVKEFSDKKDADKYAIDNHDKLMAVKKESPEPPRKPSGKNGPHTGESEFAGKHKKKLSGMRNDGTNIKEKIGDKRDWKKGFDPAEEAQLKKDKKLQKDLKAYYKNPKMSVKDAEKKVPYLLNHINTHFDGKDNGKVNDVQFSNAINFYYDSVYKESVEEVTITLDEASKPGRGKAKLDIDYIGDRDLTKKAEKKHKIKIKQTGRTTADVSGEKKNIAAFLMDPDIMGFDKDDVEDLYPELYEATKQEGYLDVEEGEELSPKQKRYQAFFKKALKKFGVESPSELDDKKKKEFFNYVDKNYDAGEGETD